MSALARYAAAIYHLGPRQAALNLLHRATSPNRSYERYRRAGRGLEWIGRARAPFLLHAGGARLDDAGFTAIGRTLPIGDPPPWEMEAPLLCLFNLHYFAWIHDREPAERRRLVLDWIARYAPGARRPGWMPYPISLRLRHWVALLLEPAAWPDAERAQVVASIEAQAECLSDTLEHHLRGNHLLESAITLKLLSACFRGAAVGKWERRAERVLEAELGEQFLLDGGHVERSPMYHARLAHGLLDLLNVLPEADDTRVRVETRLPAVLRFLAALRHPDGEIALFNDAALDIAPNPGALVDYAGRLGIATPAFAAGSFPETGYHVWRRGEDALLVDAAPLGPDYLPAHGHGDIFTFELSLAGKRIVVDGGTSTYERGPERDWVRSTRAHNTVEIAGADQAEFFAAFRVGRRGRPRDVVARVDEGGLRVAGWHDGYVRLPGRPLHHRELQFEAPGLLAVWDTVQSEAPQRAVSRVRFAPGSEVRIEAADKATIDSAGVAFSFYAFGGTLALESGHYAPRFGERHACPVLALQKGDRPDFGYLLTRRELAGWIDATGAEAGGRPILRQHRTPTSGAAKGPP